ncbi:unnamed protein product [Ranitomeya imitator]|uniref:Uncharacterized protein n=1 Tax=Ranitomeya imitator TaxID=111125 RepID=A0ABN9L6M5_9NEOB|nr:unnamed protein product [Ranitomeya imitator]
MDSVREPAMPSVEVTAITPRSRTSSSRSRQSGSSRKKSDRPIPTYASVSSSAGTLTDSFTGAVHIYDNPPPSQITILKVSQWVLSSGEEKTPDYVPVSHQPDVMCAQ